MTRTISLAIVAAAFASTASAAAPAAPAPTMLTLLPEGAVNDTEVLAPVDSEGQVVASRLTSGDAAFSVRTVSYELVGDNEDCDSGMSHMVRVWKSSALRPAATPAGVQSYQVPVAPDAGSRTINIDLSQSIRLARGESLFVAVELMQDADLGMCLAGVAVAPKDQLRQFVSTSMAAPFQWSSFDSFGAQVTMDITAYGYKVR